MAEELQAKYEDARAQLEEKEAYTRILNLERRWQHQEQNNFAAREFVQAKLAEHNYHSIKQDVQVLLDSYNTFLQESLARGPPALAWGVAVITAVVTEMTDATVNLRYTLLGM